jgi:hypothetical protein
MSARLPLVPGGDEVKVTDHSQRTLQQQCSTSLLCKCRSIMCRLFNSEQQALIKTGADSQMILMPMF